MKDPENQPPPKNRTDVIIYGYKHLLSFATTGCHHHRPLLKELPSSSPSSIATSFAATAHRCHCHHPPPPWMLPSPPPSTAAIFCGTASTLSSAAAAIIIVLRCSRHVFVLLCRSNDHIFILSCRRYNCPLLKALPPSSSSLSAANNTSVTPVRMKPSEDVTINNNNNMGKKTKEESYCRRDDIRD
jgi:hypothetical protein